MRDGGQITPKEFDTLKRIVLENLAEAEQAAAKAPKGDARGLK